MATASIVVTCRKQRVLSYPVFAKPACEFSLKSATMASNPRGQQVVQLSIAVGVVDTIAVALRLLARWIDRARMAPDDWMIVASLIPFYAMITTSSLRMMLRRCPSLLHQFANVQGNSCYKRRLGQTDGISDYHGGYDFTQGKHFDSHPVTWLISLDTYVHHGYLLVNHRQR